MKQVKMNKRTLHNNPIAVLSPSELGRAVGGGILVPQATGIIVNDATGIIVHEVTGIIVPQ